MGLEGGDAGTSARTHSDPADADSADQQGDMATLLGGLLIELGHKVQEAGIDGVRILTAAEVDRERLEWFREGWQKHARAVSEGAEPSAAFPAGLEPTGDVSAGRLLRFPERADERQALPDLGEEHSLPLVRAHEATVQELMPHRPRAPRKPSPPEEQVRPQSRPAPE
ncbi:hypothetical protein AB0N06_15800 [Streptomyces sp. NPDC051020]|uniref:hypothetical protein n=1 Tax=Streptomyces sp. NPDC051020 TaxID=3155409 RepID=UPI0034482D67